jgi:hypothetical protein
MMFMQATLFPFVAAAQVMAPAQAAMALAGPVMVSPVVAAVPVTAVFFSGSACSSLRWGDSRCGGLSLLMAKKIADLRLPSGQIMAGILQTFFSTSGQDVFNKLRHLVKKVQKGAILAE